MFMRLCLVADRLLTEVVGESVSAQTIQSQRVDILLTPMSFGGCIETHFCAAWINYAIEAS